MSGREKKGRLAALLYKENNYRRLSYKISDLRKFSGRDRLYSAQPTIFLVFTFEGMVAIDGFVAGSISPLVIEQRQQPLQKSQ
ncbi:hypothetical protein [Achromobacter pulmonis]|uniref:hypothetical protein n=1 Tax=Achromobacter pulmonis TaxID=1389932 RepID=UPI001F1E373D|nr:hypothetical protein [Achromobacter pulmonis]MCF7769477.1 hypothetical protein [Achromobacter pulmonis]